MGASAGLAITAFGAAQSASASKAAGKGQQAVADYNAKISDLQAEDALARGIEDTTRLRLKARGAAGENRVAFAAGGVDISDADSTFGEVQANLATITEMDAQAIRVNAAREAWGYKAQAQAQRAGGQLAITAANNKAIGSIVSGITSVYGAAYKAPKTTSAGSHAQNLGYAPGALPQE